MSMSALSSRNHHHHDDDDDAQSALIHTSRGPAVIAVAISLTVVSLILSAVRLLRRSSARRLGPSEYTLMASLAFCIPAAVLSALQGIHAARPSTAHPHLALQLTYYARPWTVLATASAQASLCLFSYRHIGQRQLWKRGVAAAIVVLAVATFMYTLTSNLQCQPLARMWDPSVQGSCVGDGVGMGIAVFYAAFEITLFVFLALYMAAAVGLVDGAAGIKMPYLTTAAASMGCAALAIGWTVQTARLGARPVMSDNVLIVSILSLVVENCTIFTANIIPLLPRTGAARPATPGFVFDLESSPAAAAATEKPIGREVTIGPATPLSEKQILARIETAALSDSDFDSDAEQLASPEDLSPAAVTAAAAGAADARKSNIRKTMSVHVHEEEVPDEYREAVEQHVSYEWAKIIRGSEIGVAR